MARATYLGSTRYEKPTERDARQSARPFGLSVSTRAHFEGRSWQGLHRHALMTMIAYAFLQYRRLKTARREKNNQRAAASPNLARRAPGYSRTHRSTPAAAMPALPKMDQRAAA